MSALLTRNPAARLVREAAGPPVDEPARLGDPTGPGRDDPTGPTLDDVISRAWEVLRADVPAACPACGGEMLPRHSAGGGVVGGRCDGCGTTLW
jgi:hypothetical protein